MTFTVIGTPAPQGSKRHVGRGIMIESSKKLKPWRDSVTHAAMAAHQGAAALDCACVLSVYFFFIRPKSGKKEGSPRRKPDLDKLLRSTMDAITAAGVWSDDSRVVRIFASKRFADQWKHQVPGAQIEILEEGIPR